MIQWAGNVLLGLDFSEAEGDRAMELVLFEAEEALGSQF
jgi:hypothetical protein